MKRLITIEEHYPNRMPENIRSIMPFIYSATVMELKKFTFPKRAFYRQMKGFIVR